MKKFTYLILALILSAYSHAASYVASNTTNKIVFQKPKESRAYDKSIRNRNLKAVNLDKSSKQRSIKCASFNSKKSIQKLKDKKPRIFYKDFSLGKFLLQILGVLVGIQIIWWIYRFAF